MVANEFYRIPCLYTVNTLLFSFGETDSFPASNSFVVWHFGWLVYRQKQNIIMAAAGISLFFFQYLWGVLKKTYNQQF
jgi:hypothetical protein